MLFSFENVHIHKAFDLTHPNTNLIETIEIYSPSLQDKNCQNIPHSELQYEIVTNTYSITTSPETLSQNFFYPTQMIKTLIHQALTPITKTWT